mmetsp:Transcript_25520/g.81684  ORF Transcript_25520/g.81684 Transcript_25520/m.81684 type:complete len:109 (-) Transcript_25520:214-540(-)
MCVGGPVAHSTSGEQRALAGTPHAERSDRSQFTHRDGEATQVQVLCIRLITTLISLFVLPCARWLLRIQLMIQQLQPFLLGLPYSSLSASSFSAYSMRSCSAACTPAK